MLSERKNEIWSHVVAVETFRGCMSTPGLNKPISVQHRLSSVHVRFFFNQTVKTFLMSQVLLCITSCSVLFVCFHSMVYTRPKLKKTQKFKLSFLRQTWIKRTQYYLHVQILCMQKQERNQDCNFLEPALYLISIGRIDRLFVESGDSEEDMVSGR